MSSLIPPPASPGTFSAGRLFSCAALTLALLTGPLPWTAGAVQETAAIPVELSLDTARRVLLEADPVILRAREAVAMARGDLEQAGKAPNPSLQVSSEGYDFGADGASLLERQEFVVGVGHTLELGGKRGERSRTAREALRAAEAALADVVRERRLELARRYFGLVLATRELELATGLRGDFDRLLQAAEDRRDQGEASGLELARLRSERMRFVDRELDAELSLRRRQIELAAILGQRSLPESLRLSDDLESPVPGRPSGLPTAVDPSRPDLRAQEARVAAAREALELERSQVVPDLRSFVGFMRDFDRSTFAASFTVDLPVADRNQGNVARARAALAAAELVLRLVRLRAHAELEEALAKARIGARRVEALRGEGIPSAERARDIARSAYRLGSIDLIEVLDAERAYREMLGSYLSALYELRIAETAVRAAAGVWP